MLSGKLKYYPVYHHILILLHCMDHFQIKKKFTYLWNYVQMEIFIISLKNNG